MASAIRRLFGFVDDAVTGGSSYDDLTVGAIPDATTFWPVTGGNLDRNIERVERNNEVRGVRAARPPASFKARPAITVPVDAYLAVIKKALRKTLGGVDTVATVTGVTTHTLAALGQSATAPQLPAVMAQLVRDDLNHKVSGAVWNRTSLTFSADGPATAECEIVGLYHAHFATAAPTPVFTGLDAEPLFGRDSQLKLDGAGTGVLDLQGYEFSFTNNVVPKHYFLRNIVSQSIGTPAVTRKLWFPEENKLNAAQDVTFAFNLGNTNTTQEMAIDYAQAQKLVFESAGALISGSTPPTASLLRITTDASVPTGGGADALSARDDITTRIEGGAFYSETAARDVLVEVLDGVPTATT